MILHGRSYRRVLDDLSKLGIRRRLCLRRRPSPASISRWKKTLANHVSLLIQLSFYKLARARKTRRLLAIIEGTGFRLGRTSSHYIKRARKKKHYALLTAIYSHEVNDFFDATITPDSVSELTTLRNYLLTSIANAQVFWGLLGDKRFDSSDIITALKNLGIIPIIPTRIGMLEPKGGPRLRGSLNYESFVRRVENVRNLIESAFAALKSLAQDSIRSISWKARICDVYVLVLAYNVTRVLVSGVLRLLTGDRKP